MMNGLYINCKKHLLGNKVKFRAEKNSVYFTLNKQKLPFFRFEAISLLVINQTNESPDKLSMLK